MEFQAAPRFPSANFMYQAGSFPTSNGGPVENAFAPYNTESQPRRPQSGWSQAPQNPWFDGSTSGATEPPRKKQQSMNDRDFNFTQINDAHGLTHNQRPYDMAPPISTSATSAPFTTFDSALSHPAPTTAPEGWPQKSNEERHLNHFEHDPPDIIQYYADLGEDNPVIHLNHESDFANPMRLPSFLPQPSPKRLSDSSFSQASSNSYPPLEDLASADTFSRTSEGNSWTPIEKQQPFQTPNESPAHPQHDVLKSGSRSRASPNPRNNVRPSPYTTTSSDRSKRWTIGEYAPSPQLNYNQANRFTPYGNRTPQQQAATLWNPSTMDSPQQNGQTSYLPHSFPQASFMQPMPNQNLYQPPNPQYQLSNPRPLPSQGLFRLLHSNIDAYSHGFGHSFEQSEPPDLYSSLREEASDPPPEDMNPSDPDLVPHEQELRFNGDLYTPKWVRGHGNKREGWCGLCKPGRWLVLKNSAFWYDKSFTHGVSAATGVAFQGPQETRRTEGNSDVWEGLCGSCGDWVSLVSSKKKGTTWFRHAYKCHTHPKVKDAPKRRRETVASMRARTTSSGSGGSGASPPHLKPDADVHSHHAAHPQLDGLAHMI